MATTYFHLLPLILRITQAILTLTTLILYATTYSTALSGAPEDTSSYIYALICCTLTLLTLACYFIPSFPTPRFFLWDFCVAVLWAALGGSFGMRYLREDGGVGQGDTEGGDRNGSRAAMNVAVEIDLVIMGCWIITCFWGCVGYVRVKVQMRKQKREGREVESVLEGQEQGIVEWDDRLDGECEKGLMGEKGEKEQA
jgi:hypothetical protein